MACRTDGGYPVDNLEHLDMLCGLCRRVEESGNNYLIDNNEKLRKWWVRHKNADAKKIADEAEYQRKLALAKDVKSRLSDDELSALRAYGNSV